MGETDRAPARPDGENFSPVPVQAVALVLVQEIFDDSPFGIELGDAERVTVGAAGVAACAMAIPEGLAGCAGAPSLRGAAMSRISCSGDVASRAAAGISVKFGWEPELGDEAACPEVNSGKTKKPTNVNSVFLNIRRYVLLVRTGT